MSGAILGVLVVGLLILLGLTGVMAAARMHLLASFSAPMANQMQKNSVFFWLSIALVAGGVVGYFTK